MNFAFPKRCETCPGAPLKWELWAFSVEVKWRGREADHSPTSSAEVKEGLELYPYSPNTPSWCGAQLNHRDKFTFPFMLLQDILE